MSDVSIGSPLLSPRARRPAAPGAVVVAQAAPTREGP